MYIVSEVSHMGCDRRKALNVLERLRQLSALSLFRLSVKISHIFCTLFEAIKILNFSLPGRRTVFYLLLLPSFKLLLRFYLLLFFENLLIYQIDCWAIVQFSGCEFKAQKPIFTNGQSQCRYILCLGNFTYAKSGNDFPFILNITKIWLMIGF